MTTCLSRVWRGYRLAVRFIRFPSFCLAGVLPLLGAASASPPPSVVQILLLLSVALSGLTFASLLNDVVDLPIDRTEIWRQDDLLVNGAIRPGLALLLALGQVPVTLLLTSLLDASVGAYLALGSAYLGLMIYDIWGKRCPFPPLTDFALGFGCAMLVVYGAAALPSGPSRETLVAFIFIVLYTMLAHGTHHGLLDLANDFDHHAHTTAALLGARPGPSGPSLSRPLILYALTLQVALAVTILLPLSLGWFGDPGGLALAGTLFIQMLSFAYWPITPWVLHRRVRLLFFANAHVLIMLCALIALYVQGVALDLRLALVAVFLVPLLTSRKYPENPFMDRRRPKGRVLRSSLMATALDPDRGEVS